MDALVTCLGELGAKYTLVLIMHTKTGDILLANRPIIKGLASYEQ